MKNITISVLVMSVIALGCHCMILTQERDAAEQRYYDVVAAYNQQVSPERNQIGELEKKWKKDGIKRF